MRRGRAIDVARHGLFVAVVDPPQNRHLVQVVIHLPEPFRGTVQAAATVSRTLSGQGVGLSLFALSDDAKNRWDHFIASLQHHQHQQSATPDASAAPAGGAGTGAPSFLLRLKTLERLREFQRTHVTIGGTVLFTPVLLPENAPVAVVVVHPTTHQEHVLLGRVYRSIAQPPKRLEILFANIDHVGFDAFVATGVAQAKPAPKPLPLPPLAPAPLPLPPLSSSAPRPPLTEPPHPTSSLAPMTVLPSPATDEDLDIEVFDDEEVADDPIEWDLRTSDLPVLMGRAVTAPPQPAPAPQPAPPPPTTTHHAIAEDVDVEATDVSRRAPPRAAQGLSAKPDLRDIHVSVVDGSALPSLPVPAAPPAVAPSLPMPAAVVRDDDEEYNLHVDSLTDDVDELLIDDTRVAVDPGLRPTPLRVSCDSCTAESYVVELGPCGGVLGLVADLVPFWSSEQSRIVSVPRLVGAVERRERFHRYLDRGGQIEDLVSMGGFLAAADLAESPLHPVTAEPLKTSRTIERLGVAGRRVAEEDVVAPTRVQCPHCSDGHLVVEKS